MQLTYMCHTTYPIAELKRLDVWLWTFDAAYVYVSAFQN